MGLFGFLKKKDENEDKFRDKVIDEIDRLNQEFANQVPDAQPDLPPPIEGEPAPAPSMEDDAPVEVEEPRDIDEDRAEKKEALKKMSKPKKKEEKKSVSKEATHFNAKVEKIKKKLESSKQTEELQRKMKDDVASLKDNFNGKLNKVIDQIRDLNLAVKNADLQKKQLTGMQDSLDTLTAQVDDMRNQLRALDSIETLRRDVVSVKNSMRDKPDGAVLEQMKKNVDANTEKIHQMLALVEALTE